MHNSFKAIFKLSNKYIVLATPLILFSLISSVYLSVSLNGKLLNILIAIVLLLLMSGAFVAGWFNMVKCAIVSPPEEDPNSLLKEFPSGVGEYFLSALGLIVNSFIFMAIALTAAYGVGLKLIGDPEISGESLSKAIQNAEALKEFLASLSAEQLAQLNHWNLLLLGVMAIAYFLLILYLPAMFFKDKNPLKAFWISIKDIFGRKFFVTLGIYLLVFVVNFVLSILAALSVGNMIMNFVVTLTNFYCLVIFAIGIFYYYYNNFVRSQLGQNFDTRV